MVQKKESGDLMEWKENLISKINDKSAVIGIVGMGYVGLPLAVAFSKKFDVIGYNKSEDKTELLKKRKIVHRGC